MEVSLKLETWKIVKDKETKAVSLAGEYTIEAMGMTIAKQSFNSDYSSVKFPFSANLVQRIQDLEKDILSEINGLVKPS